MRINTLLLNIFCRLYQNNYKDENPSYQRILQADEGISEFTYHTETQ